MGKGTGEVSLESAMEDERQDYLMTATFIAASSYQAEMAYPLAQKYRGAVVEVLEQ